VYGLWEPWVIRVACALFSFPHKTRAYIRRIDRAETQGKRWRVRPERRGKISRILEAWFSDDRVPIVAEFSPIVDADGFQQTPAAEEAGCIEVSAYDRGS